MNKLIAPVTAALALLVATFTYSPVAVALVDALPHNSGCNVGLGNAQEGGWWQQSNGGVGGIRAPINLRRDGLLCTDTNSDDFASAWISIQQGVWNGNGTGIT